jgi:tetratricopeptide (TPR) repeat protein
MPLDARLELFARVCDAVQHAHEKGIVHRDLKPSNVLVEQREGRSRLHIVDFGIARALSAPLARAEPPVPLADSLGTPAYMSPERVMAGDPLVDTRDDVYSLGVMLFQLVTARLPYEATDRIERLRVIQRDPPAPSARLEELGPELAAVAAARASTPHELVRRVRGELDALVLAALARERMRRYGSAGALAEDLRRFLADEPLVAMGVGTTYRAAKFVQRHRVRLMLGAALSLTLVLGIIGTAYGWNAARAGWAAAEERGEAESGEREEADLLVRVFQEAIMMAQADDELTVADLLDQLAARVGQLGVESPESESALHAALGRSFLALGDDRQALEQFRSAYIRGSNLLQDDPFDRLDVLEGLIEGTRRTGDRAGARVYVRELVQVARAAFGGRDAKFGAALESLLSLAAGAPVPGEQALAALHEVLVCLSDGIVRGDESGALARILIEAAVQLQEQRSPLADDFLAVLERRVIDFFAARDVRRLTYLWSLQHVRVLPPGEPLQSPAETERAARALVRAADAQLAFGHWLRSDARRLLARARIDRVRIAAEAGTIDREAYTEARELLAQALREAQRTPRAHRIPLVAEELGLLAAVRPDGMEPDPELQALLDEAHATPTPVPSAEPAEPSEPTRSPAPER